MMMEDYVQLYHLEEYLFEVVSQRFHEDGWINAFDFFCIVIWKANRAKSKIAAKLLKSEYPNLDEAVKALSSELSQAESSMERMKIIFKDWRFSLPMASAILTVFYPEEFTVYDSRVCKELRRFQNLKNISKFERLWERYQEFITIVREKTPKELSLRDKDRWLWGKSFRHQLKNDINQNFRKGS